MFCQFTFVEKSCDKFLKNIPSLSSEGTLMVGEKLYRFAQKSLTHSPRGDDPAAGSAHQAICPFAGSQTNTHFTTCAVFIALPTQASFMACKVARLNNPLRNSSDCAKVSWLYREKRSEILSWWLREVSRPVIQVDTKSGSARANKLKGGCCQSLLRVRATGPFQFLGEPCRLLGLNSSSS